MAAYLARFVVYAGLPFTRFQVRRVRSFPKDKAIFPEGCTATHVTAENRTVLLKNQINISLYKLQDDANLGFNPTTYKFIVNDLKIRIFISVTVNLYSKKSINNTRTIYLKI